MRPSFEELKKLADKVTTFRQWLNFAMIEADRYTFDYPEHDVNEILNSWHNVCGRPNVAVMRAYIAGTQKVPGDFIGDIWGVWKGDLELGQRTEPAKSRASLVLKAWDRIRDIDDPDVLVEGWPKFWHFTVISPGRAVIEDEIKHLGFSIGSMFDFDAQYELIHETRLRVTDYILGKNRRGE